MVKPSKELETGFPKQPGPAHLRVAPFLRGRDDDNAEATMGGLYHAELPLEPGTQRAGSLER